MSEDENLLKEAKKFPWEDRLADTNWKVRNEASVDLASLCASIIDTKDPRLRDFRDPHLVNRIGAANALEVRATGIPYKFVEIPDGVGAMRATSHYKHGVSFVGGKDKVAACEKHYVGDGGTTGGIFENNTVTDLHGLLRVQKVFPQSWFHTRAGMVKRCMQY